MISLVLDKSAFQRIAELDSELQVRAWNYLHTHFQVVIPAILIEEVIINLADPGGTPPALVREMMKSLIRIEPCWMDDVFEIAFRELVEEKPVRTLPAFPPEFARRIRTLSSDNPELLEWAKERRANREALAQTRMVAQDKLLPREKRREMDDEVHFWIGLKDQFLNILKNGERCTELLEVVLGGIFRARHPDAGSKIDEAFGRFTSETFVKYYVTLSILMVRLAYMYAPLVHFKKCPTDSVRRFVRRSPKDQRNNASDEQYIVAAMISNRLLTRDEGMKNIIEMFRLNGFTKCQTTYLNVPVIEQILAMKS